MGCGCHCGSIRTIPAAVPVSPLEIAPADDIIAGWDAAVRVDTAGAVSVLPDVSGNGFNLTQAVAASQPTAVIGGGPNGNDSILWDGIDDSLVNSALDLPAPSVTALTFWGVLRQVNWVGGGVSFWATGSGPVALLQINASPNIIQLAAAGANENSGLAVNVYQLLEVLFSDSTSDAIRTSILTTGQSAGDTDSGVGFFLGGMFILELCELWIFGTALTIQQRSQLRAYATARYGPIP